MFDQIFIVERITGWTGLGIRLPKELANAIKTFEAIRYAEVENNPVLDLAEITSENAEEKLRQFADELTPTLPLIATPGVAGKSILAEAKQHALNLASRDLLAKAGAAVPDLVEQLTPRLDEAAAAFVEAVAELPDDLSNAGLVRGGPAVLAAYQEALAAQALLVEIDSWVASLSALPIQGLSGPVDPALRVLRPTNAVEARQLEAAPDTFGQLVPRFVVAARLGVEFAINVPQDAARLRADIETQADAERERRRVVA